MILKPYPSPTLAQRRRPSAWLALPAVAAAALAGCAATKPIGPYAAPASGPSAKLVMRGQVAQGDRYGVFVMDDADKCSGPRIAGAGGPGRTPPSTALPAGRLATVDFILVKPSKQVCSVRWSFTPVAGRTYLVAGMSSGATGCAARVMDMTDPEALKPEATALRRNPPGSASCLPLGQSRAAGSGAGGAASGAEAVLRPSAGTEDLQGLIEP